MVMETKSSLLRAAGRWRLTPHSRRGRAGPHFQPQASTCAPRVAEFCPVILGASCLLRSLVFPLEPRGEAVGLPCAPAVLRF